MVEVSVDVVGSLIWGFLGRVVAVPKVPGGPTWLGTGVVFTPWPLSGVQVPLGEELGLIEVGVEVECPGGGRWVVECKTHCSGG